MKAKQFSGCEPASWSDTTKEQMEAKSTLARRNHPPGVRSFGFVQFQQGLVIQLIGLP